MPEIDTEFRSPEELEKSGTRDSGAFLDLVFCSKGWGRADWGWSVSPDGKYIDMGPVTRNGLSDEFIDERVDSEKVRFSEGIRGVGLDDLVLKLEGKKVKSLLTEKGIWILEIIE
jgi:hypothetical protein